MRRYAPQICALAWLLLAVLWFVPLGVPALFNPDEGRYAEIPREMTVSGDWVTPRLDAIKYFEKPPLQYWMTAVAERLIGPDAFAARLWSAVCGFLGLLATRAVARRLYGERAGWFAIIVQGSALLYAGLARIATLDMGLCFTLQIALNALVLLVPRAASVTPRAAMTGRWATSGEVPSITPIAEPSPRVLAALLALAVALAMLSKGLVGILIPGAVGVIYMLFYRDARLLRTARPQWTAVALAVIAAPWFVVVSLRNPGFARFFFLFEHFQRFLHTEGFDRYHPIGFFVPVLVGGMLPWITLLPRSLWEAGFAARREPATGLLLIWSVFVFGFFSISHSKLVPYILPMVPALSLLMGRTLARLPARRLAAHLTALATLAALLAVALLVTLLLARSGSPRPLAWLRLASLASVLWFLAAFAVQALGAGLGALFGRRGHGLLAAAAAGLGGLLLMQAMLLGVGELRRMRGELQLVQALQPWAARYRHFYCVNGYLQSVPFYLQRTCTLVGYRGELDFGLSMQPSLAVPRFKEFVGVWERDDSALALVRAEDYPRLVALGAQMRVIYTSPSYVAVVRQ